MITATIKSAAQRILAWPIGRPWTVLGVAATLAVLAAISTARIQKSNSLSDLLGRQSGSAATLQRVMEEFAVVDELLLLVTDENPDGLRTPEESVDRLLRFAGEFEKAVGASPQAPQLIARVRHGADSQMLDFVREQVVPAGLFYLSDDEFGALRERLTPAAMKEQIRQNEAMIAAPGPAAGALAKQLLRDPLRLREFLAGRLGAQQSVAKTWNGGTDFISPEGRALLIRVSGVRPASDLEFCTRLTVEVQSLADGIKPQELRVELAGSYAIAATSSASIRADVISNIFWDIVLMQAVYLIAFRRLWAFPVAILPVALGILLGFGLFSLMGYRLTPLTAVIATMLAGLGIDYCIHYMSHYESVRGEKIEPPEAARRTIADIGLPLFAAGITSVHGFLAIAFSGAAVLRDFALLGAIGLAFSVLSSVIVMPALLRVSEGIRLWKRRRVTHGAARFSFRFLIDPISRHARPCMTLSLAVLAAMIAIIGARSLPRLESDLSVMHPAPNPALEGQRRIVQIFGGVAEPLLVHFAAGSPGELVTKAHAIHRALTSPDAARVGVQAVFGLATLLPDPSSRSAGAARSATLDAERIAADFLAAINDSAFDPAAYTEYADFLRKLLSAKQGPGLDVLRRYPSLAASLLANPRTATSTNPPLGHEAITYVFFDRSLDDRAERDAAVLTLRRLLADIPGATLTGVTVVAYDIEAMVRHDIPRIVAACAIAVFLTVLAFFRRFQDVVLILIPVSWSLVSLLAYMALSGEAFNLVNLVAMPLLMGICVDYGIFAVGLARAARQERRAGNDHHGDGLAKRLGASAHAMFMTGVTTIIGFGTLVTTGTPAIQSLGRMTAVGVISCLLGTTLLLVPILIILDRRDIQSREA